MGEKWRYISYGCRRVIAKRKLFGWPCCMKGVCKLDKRGVYFSTGKRMKKKKSFLSPSTAALGLRVWHIGRDEAGMEGLGRAGLIKVFCSDRG